MLKPSHWPQDINDRTVYVVDTTTAVNDVQNDAPSNVVKNPTTTTPSADTKEDGTTSISVDTTSNIADAKNDAKSSDKNDEQVKMS